MGENVIRLYLDGKITVAGLSKAVSFNWITAERYTDLTGNQYEPAATETDYKAALEELGVNFDG